MTLFSIGQASAIYERSSRCEIIRHRVHDAPLQRLCGALHDLIADLGEEVDDSHWRSIVRPLRRFTFQLCSSPLTPTHPDLLRRLNPELTTRLLRASHSVFPQFQRLAENVADCLARVLESSNSSLLETLVSLASEYPFAAIVAQDSQSVPLLDSLVSSTAVTRTYAVVSPTQLRTATCYGALFLFGTSRWYPQHVLMAPRADTVLLISYRWLNDTWNPSPTFVSGISGAPHSTSYHRGALVSIRNVDDVQPVVVFDSALHDTLWPYASVPSTLTATKAPTPQLHDETVEAVLVALDGGYCVYLEADDRSSAIVIDLDNHPTRRVVRMPLSELEPGMYLLLRTVGGGDYIAALADRLLGSSAIPLRGKQALWKSALRALAENRFGYPTNSSSCSRLADLLRGIGSPRATSTHVRYWLSPKCIKTGYTEDFFAILHACGLENRSQELWAAMRQLSNAHQRAGQHIRRMLLRRVMETDLHDLARHGRMEFELNEADGGSLTAFRICREVSDVTFVLPSTLNTLFELEDDPWHG